MSVALPDDPKHASASECASNHAKKCTRCPLVLRSRIPVFAVEAEGEEVPVNVHGDAGGRAHGARSESRKSDEGEEREHCEDGDGGKKEEAAD